MKLYRQVVILFFLTNFFVSCGPLDDEKKDTKNRSNSSHALPGKSHDQRQKNDDLPSQDRKDSPESQQPGSDLGSDPLAYGLSLIEKKNLVEQVTLISGDEFEGRGTGERGNQKAALWLAERLQEYGIPPVEGEQYLQPFRARGRPTNNVIGLIRGNHETLKDEYVVLGAHMDHLGIIDCRGSASDRICNGADDNASGTIGLLNIAKSLAVIRKHLKRSVVIAFFSGEELGLLGSYFYVQNDPLVPIKKTVYMINLDMIAYQKSLGAIDMLGGGTSKVAEEHLREINKKKSKLKFNITKRAGGGSDHVPFMASGIPGVFFHTGVANNPHYHRPSDTVTQPGFDFDGMKLVTEIAFEHSVRVINDERLSIEQTSFGQRPSLVTEEEKAQQCHHLGLNPHSYGYRHRSFTE